MRFHIVTLLPNLFPGPLAESVTGRALQQGLFHLLLYNLRDYGIGAQILRDIGVRNMILLSNVERTIVGLEGYGLSVVGRRKLAWKDEEKT